MFWGSNGGPDGGPAGRGGQVIGGRLSQGQVTENWSLF